MWIAFIVDEGDRPVEGLYGGVGLTRIDLGGGLLDQVGGEKMALTELAVDAIDLVGQGDCFVKSALVDAQRTKPSEQGGAQRRIACAFRAEPPRVGERLLSFLETPGNAQGIGILAPADSTQIGQLRSAAGDCDGTGLSGQPRQMGEMEHTSRVLVANGVAHLDELMD